MGKFIGRYHGYRNSVGVVSKDLGGALSYNENGCGALTTALMLAAGETKEIAFLLGMKYKEEADKIFKSYQKLSAPRAMEWSRGGTKFPHCIENANSDILKKSKLEIDKN